MTRMMTVLAMVAVTTMAGGAAGSAEAQPAGAERPKATVEGTGGYAGFLDDDVIHHRVLGGGARVYLSRRVSLGPELTAMFGPGNDRDLLITVNVVYDVLAPTRARPRRTTPFVVLGAGLYRHSDRFVSRTFTATEGGFTGGIGVRTWLTDRVYLAGDARAGWEPHLRLAVSVGMTLP